MLHVSVYIFLLMFAIWFLIDFQENHRDWFL